MQKYIDFSSGGRYARLKLFGYYLQRIITSRTIRRFATQATIAWLRMHYGINRLAERRFASTETMRHKGHLSLGKLLSADQCNEIHSYLCDKQLYASRSGGGGPFRLHSVPDGTAIGDYSLYDVVNCPHIIEIANHPIILALAANYIGYIPTITTLGIRWSFPTNKIDEDVQGFHRDSEIGSIKIMIYLTDVDAGSGPHVYVQGTHLDRVPVKLRRHSDMEVMCKHGGGVSITGPAGTAFAIDTKGIHKGAPPLSQPRLLLGIQYSLLPCLIYEYEPVAYQGNAPFDRYINRLMVKTRSTRPSHREQRPEMSTVHD